ncbi:plasmid replication protein RepC [Cereibacter sp. SYSU M97828]|nr:plasmid replication protein RepC [Cereibacter flavus]
MTFIQAFKPAQASVNTHGLSAGNDLDIWKVFRTVRDAASVLGIKGDVIRTLETMIGFLRPGNGMTCFASNREIQRRLGGVSDKTVRRHAAKLVEAGLVRRVSSPNGKRYASRSPLDGSVEAYGFDLSPMLSGLDRWLDLEAAQREDEALKRHLRTQILARLSFADAHGQTGLDTVELRKIIRRKLSSDQFRSILHDVESLLDEVASHLKTPVAPTLPSADVSVSGGQNDRDHSTSNTNAQDEKTHDKLQGRDHMTIPRSETNSALLGKITGACGEALSFSERPITSWSDMVRHAEKIAPMIGIDQSLMQIARGQFGTAGAVVSVLLMVQMYSKVRNMRAYYRSLVAGKRRTTFDPLALLERMSRQS